MWHCLYRTSTEHWQKTSDFLKDMKTSIQLDRMREKRKQREKNLDGSCTPGKGSYNLGIPSLAGDQPGRGASEPKRRAQHLCNRQNRSDLHRQSVLPRYAPQPEMLICIIWASGGWLHRDRLNVLECGN